jgi:hypothetical protein
MGLGGQCLYLETYAKIFFIIVVDLLYQFSYFFGNLIILIVVV